MDEEVVRKIIAFTDTAHGDQMRKYTPERYIVHPVKVMKTCRKYTPNAAVLAAALLHDVLEDTPVSEDQIRSFLLTLLPPSVVDETLKLVIELTDVYTKGAYPRLNRRKRKQKEFERLAATSPDAQTIKYADILDNALDIAESDPDFGRVFLEEAMTLLEDLDKGDPHLYREVKETVQRSLALLQKKVLSQKQTNPDHF